MDATRVKAVATVLIIVSGALLGAAITIKGDPYTVQTEGMIVDFGSYQTKWTALNPGDYDDAITMLETCCQMNGYSYTVKDGTVIEIDGIHNSSGAEWKFWTMDNGGSGWELGDKDASPAGHKAICWSIGAEGDEPVVAVDALGNCVFGLPRAFRVVSLSPSITEILGALDATSSIVGMDDFSDYPHSVRNAKEKGLIDIVGGYTNPSFESIIKTDPDIVLCDGSENSHVVMCEKLNKHGIRAITLYNGTDIKSIMDNVFIAGLATGYDMLGERICKDTSMLVNEMRRTIHNHPFRCISDVLVTLSNVKSPHASGHSTYINDTLMNVEVNNVIDNRGWVRINSEIIAKSNPDVIVVMSPQYSNTDSDYEKMINELPDEWKSTDAYKEGRIYLLCEGASNMGQRSTPRVVQLMELLGRIVQPNVFTDIELPKHIGDDYSDFLTYTKNYGYDN